MSVSLHVVAVDWDQLAGDYPSGSRDPYAGPLGLATEGGQVPGYEDLTEQLSDTSLSILNEFTIFHLWIFDFREGLVCDLPALSRCGDSLPGLAAVYCPERVSKAAPWVTPAEVEELVAIYEGERPHEVRVLEEWAEIFTRTAAAGRGLVVLTY